MTASGVFYPAATDNAEERLQYYASRFPVVEVDATYYALPSRRLSELWVERRRPTSCSTSRPTRCSPASPPKRSGCRRQSGMRCPRSSRRSRANYAKDLPDELAEEVWAQFADGLAPLTESGQRVPSSSSTRSGSSRARSSATRSARRTSGSQRHGLLPAVEFRNATCSTRRTSSGHAFLEDEKIPLVMVDGPQGFKSSVPPIVATTHPDLAVVRFHGRRTATWESMKGLPTVERFRYLYGAGAGGMGPAHRRRSEADEGHAVLIEQLLRQLRLDQCPGAGADARGGALVVAERRRAR